MELENLSTKQIEQFCKEGLEQLKNKELNSLSALSFP